MTAVRKIGLASFQKLTDPNAAICRSAPETEKWHSEDQHRLDQHRLVDWCQLESAPQMQQMASQSATDIRPRQMFGVHDWMGSLYRNQTSRPIYMAALHACCSPTTGSTIRLQQMLHSKSASSVEAKATVCRGRLLGDSALSVSVEETYTLSRATSGRFAEYV